MIHLIKQYNNLEGLNEPEMRSVPILFSNCTNWAPKPFMTVLDFLEKLNEAPRPDFEALADEALL